MIGNVRIMVGMKCRVALLFVTASASAVSSACGCFGPKAQMVSQQNMIIWDKEKGVEHFIRRASFNAEGEKVGFVAPTPSVPELGEIDPKVFETTNRIVRERAGRLRKAIEERGMENAPAAAASAGGVTIEQIVDVAGYKAVTISATNSQEVKKWVKENKFESFEGEKEWFDFYLKKKWYLTFFLVNKDPSGQFATGTVRMSFKTNAPFNPYYVPKGNQNSDAHLRLYFISKDSLKPDPKMQAGDHNDQRFRLSDRSFEQIKADLKGVTIDFNEPVLYALDDFGFAQGAREDLYFIPDDKTKIYGEFEIPGQSGSGVKVAVFTCFMGAFVAIMAALKAKRAKLVG
jgi:hypothetical protein